MPGFCDDGTLAVTYATEARCIEEWLSAHSGETALGFDTETRPTFRKGVVHPPATLQLSTPTDCLVAHLLHLDTVPTALVEVLASTQILKAGVGVDNDAIELWLHHGLEVRARLDLADGAAAALGVEAKSLSGLTADVLGVTLNKSRRLQLTNWARRALSVAEAQYAALDAWAGRALHDELARQHNGGGGGGGGASPLSEWVVGERTCAELYAFRRMRQALKQLFTSLNMDLSENGLPHRQHPMSEAGRRDTRAVQRSIDKARRSVAPLFAAGRKKRAGGGGRASGPSAAQAKAVAPPAPAVDADGARVASEAAARQRRLEVAREQDAAEAATRAAERERREGERARRRVERKLKQDVDASVSDVKRE